MWVGWMPKDCVDGEISCNFALMLRNAGAPSVSQFTLTGSWNRCPAIYSIISNTTSSTRNLGNHSSISLNFPFEINFKHFSTTFWVIFHFPDDVTCKIIYNWMENSSNLKCIGLCITTRDVVNHFLSLLSHRQFSFQSVRWWKTFNSKLFSISWIYIIFLHYEISFPANINWKIF